MLLTEPLGVAGLAISSTISSTLYALLLLIPLQKQGGGVLNAGFGKDTMKMLLSTVGMAAVVLAVRYGLENLLPQGKLGELVLLGICALIGVAVYFLLATLTGLDEAKMVRDMAKRVWKRG